MKKTCILFLTLFIILLTAVFGLTANPSGAATANEEYLRIHIRANSNSDEDQAVKYKVRDALCEAIMPLAAECTDKATAVRLIDENISVLCRRAEEVLRRNGYFYGVRAQIRREEFPLRVYEEYTLEAGEYDALIVELGEGKGDNWWCCIYPPFCFTGGNGNVTYRSKIAEIIEKFFSR